MTKILAHLGCGKLFADWEMRTKTRLQGCGVSILEFLITKKHTLLPTDIRLHVISYYCKDHILLLTITVITKLRVSKMLISERCD